MAFGDMLTAASASYFWAFVSEPCEIDQTLQPNMKGCVNRNSFGSRLYSLNL